MMLKNLSKLKNKTRGEKRKEYLEAKKYYVAGGGDPETFKKLKQHARTWHKRHLDKYTQMIRQRKLYDVSDSPFYVIIGEK